MPQTITPKTNSRFLFLKIREYAKNDIIYQPSIPEFCFWNSGICNKNDITYQPSIPEFCFWNSGIYHKPLHQIEKGSTMPERIVPFEENNYYYLFNRGVNKGLIFFSDRNYDFFLYKMTKYFQQYATILAYCLMPNHFHLLVRIDRSDFFSKALQPFLIAYTRAVNIDQERVGPLFQGRYKANKIEDEEYLLDCAKYIHLNPVKAGFVNLPIEWTYSSYHIYVRNKENSSIDTSILLDFFDSIKDFQEYSESDIDQYQSKYFKDYS